MGILNTHKDIKMLGENNDAYRHLTSFYTDMIRGLQGNQTCEQNHNLHGTVNSWYNDFTPQLLKKCIRDMVCNIIDPENQYSLVGFKEIRYPSHGAYITNYLNLLHTLFDCKFIFLTRDLNKTCISKWWAENTEGCIDKLSRFEKQIKSHIKNTKTQKWFHVTYEQLIKGDVVGLFEFLDVHYDKAVYERIQKVLQRKHSY